MRVAKRIVFVTLIIILAYGSAFIDAAEVYMGPNGETYIGDYLPNELVRKGYLPKKVWLDMQEAKKGTKQPEDSARKGVLLNEAKQDAPNGYKPAGEHWMRLSVPRETWALEITASGFKTETMDMDSTGAHAMFLAENKENHLLLTAFIDKGRVTPGDTGAHCREKYQNSIKGNPAYKMHKEERLSEVAKIPVVEYMVKDFNGFPIEQKNVHAFLTRNGACTEVHLSKVLFTPSDMALFENVLRGVSINDRFVPDSLDYFNYAQGFFRGKNYSNAEQYYLQAIDAMEKEKDYSSNRQMWLNAVDNLGTTYGMSGNYKRAKEIFAYGLSKEPAYPMFYYNLACVYAESGDLDKALANLNIAFKYKSNTLLGKKMPDPMEDSSFKRYLKDSKFIKAVQELKKM